MDFDDTRAYIEHRLEVAGGLRAATFTTGALKKIFRYSHGIPRLINIVCDRALLMGYIDESREISRSMAARAVAEVSERRRRPAMFRLAPGIALFVVLCAAGAMYAFLHKATNRFPLPPRAANSVIASPSLDDADPGELRRTLRVTGEAESAEWAFNAMAGLWSVRPLDSGERARTPRELEKAAESRGLQLALFNGSLDRMLGADAPALLELKLAGSGGRRYLALTGREGGRFVVSLPVKGRVSLGRAELEGLWSGRAYLPWKNSLDIPNLSRGMRGEAVSRLQRLMREAGAYNGGVTGVFGGETTSAIKAFQSANGIARDGKPGNQTLLFLYGKVDRFPSPRLGKKGGELP
jgi:general secretion pathway protein A